MFPRVLFTKQRDLFLHFCVSNICSYSIYLASGRITSWVTTRQSRSCSPQTPHEGKHRRPPIPSSRQCVPGKRDTKEEIKKTPPGIHIYLSSSAFYPHSTELFFLALLRGKAVLVHLRAGGCWAARVIAVGADSDNLLFPLIFLVPLARINAVWQSKCASAAVN